jgi:alcohol dehydrogenase class IV
MGAAMAISVFSFPTTIHFGPQARDLAGPHLMDLGARRPLVVTDRGVAELAIFTDVIANLAAAGLDPEPFSGVWGNPVVSQVTAGVDAYRSHGADAVVAIGGGAAMDVGKAVALLATHPGALFDYEDGREDAPPITAAVAPIVALPTTAGTGSEVGRSAVISDDATHVKHIVFSPHLLPRAVFADPELTYDLPAPITAATGIDALTHNVEAYLARDYHPICDGIALEGIRLAHEHLATAVASPRDARARGGMLMCSMMGAIAFQKGLGLVHSTAHALGTAADLHHGLANALMIDHALAWNVEAVPDRFTTMAVAAGLDDTTPEGFLRWLADLKAEIGLPRSLVDTDVPRDALDELARLAFEDTCHLNNPRPVTEADFAAIFTAAFA